MTDLDKQIENLKKRLQQKKEAKRQVEAKQRAKEQRELDRHNLLLGRALAETCGAAHLEKLRGYIGQYKSRITILSDKDFDMLMGYFETLIEDKTRLDNAMAGQKKSA